MRRLRLVLFGCIIIELLLASFLSGVGGYGGDRGDQQKKEVTPTPAFGWPMRLAIPAVSLVAEVEEVGVDSQGRMEAPKDFFSVGWYAGGTKPGWPGNVVIAGHYDTASGSPAVFYNLNKVPLGATILLSDEIGRVLTYRVDRFESRPEGDWEASEIFSQSNMPQLVLITCSGWWNPWLRSYSHRHIVFAHLVN